MELEDIVNEEMITTEDVNDMLEHTDKGRTKQTIRNCVTVLQNDPVLKKAIKRNELSGRMDIVKEVPWERRNNSPTVTDTDEYNLKMYLEEHYEITSERVIKAGIDIVSNENKYHPIRDYLESLVWDGIPRIENMLPHFLGAEKSKYTIGVMKMHMLAAISRIYEPGIKYDIMLCLVGSQGAGKSTFFKYLAIKEEWFSDNLDHLDDENIYRKLQNHWIIEMGEMKALAFCRNVTHARMMCEALGERYKTAYLTGRNDIGERIRAYNDLQDDTKDLEILFTVDILNEGVDIPGVNMVLFLRPTESTTIFIQQLGRGLRKYPNKEYVTVLDFIGNSYKRSVQIAFALGSLAENFVMEKRLMASLVKDDFCRNKRAGRSFFPI